MTGFSVTPLTLELAPAWSELCRACGSGCFCRYWHFEGTKNEWLARLAESPETNELEQRAALASGDASAHGLVAFEGDLAVGWVKLAPRSTASKLRKVPVYRALDLGPDEGVVSVACFLVRPTHRRRGVARALLVGSIAAAKRAGARALEAYPHCRSEALRDEELWLGPMSLFEAHGFRSVGGNTAYPVLRHDLDHAARDVRDVRDVRKA